MTADSSSPRGGDGNTANGPADGATKAASGAAAKGVAGSGPSREELQRLTAVVFNQIDVLPPFA
eukprot:5610756-Prymnesium_polylepis.1